MKLIKRLSLGFLGFRIWLKRTKLAITLVLVIVIGAVIITWSLAPLIPYETMISVLTALVEFAGLLIAFEAVVAVQLLAAYRSELEHAIDKEEVWSRRRMALWNVRFSMVFFILAVMISVVLMAQLRPGSDYFSFWLFFVAYALLAGVVGLFLIVEEL